MDNYRIAEDTILTAEEFHKKFSTPFNCGTDATAQFANEADPNKIDGREIIVKLKPVNDVIKCPPSSHEELTLCLCERLRANFSLVNDHSQLIDVLCMNLTTVWQDYRRQPSHPFLNEIGNIELRRRVAVAIVEAAESLFSEYSAKALVLKEKKVFSSTANISRLKTQISNEAFTRLNVANARRKVIESMQMEAEREMWFQHNTKHAAIINKEPTNCTVLKKYIQKQIHEMTKEMPVLSKTSKMFVPIPKLNLCTSSQLQVHKEEKEIIEIDEHRNRSSSHESDISSTNDELCHHFLSVTNISLDEMDCDKEPRRCHSAQDILCGTQNELCGTQKTNSEKEMIYLTEDLENLYKREASVDFSNEDAFSSLLQAGQKYHCHQQEVSEDKDRSPSITSTISLTDINETYHEDFSDVLNVKMPDGWIYRIFTSKLADVKCEADILLKPTTVIYNEFLDEEHVESLDSHLHTADDIEEVFKGIGNSVNKNHMCMEKDDYVEACSTRELLQTYASTVCNVRSKVVNRDLVKMEEAPWKCNANLDVETWRNEPTFEGVGREDIRQYMKRQDCLKSSMRKEPNKKVEDGQKKMQSACKLWTKESGIDVEDYMKFLSSTGNDFLTAVFHLYDSGDDDPYEHETEEERQEAEEKRRRREDIINRKTTYTPGLWNAECVALGGLGKDPFQEDFVELKEKSVVESLSAVDIQERLEAIWDTLKMSEPQCFKMAMKYGTANQNLIKEVLEIWGEVAKFVAQREALIEQLEEFEKSASDPNRFFEKGVAGSSITRMAEAKTRTAINKSIMITDSNLVPLIDHIEKKFKDEVTFEGRPYRSTMQSDRTEMLYWLQQQRRNKRQRPCLSSSDHTF